MEIGVWDQDPAGMSKASAEAAAGGMLRGKVSPPLRPAAPRAPRDVPWAGCAEETRLSSLSRHEHSPVEEKCVANYYILNHF